MESAAVTRFEERRRSSRFDLHLPVQIVKMREDEVNIEAHTLNMSSVGAYFAFDSELAQGLPLEFMVSLPAVEGGDPDGVRLRCRGHVARADSLSGEQRYGIATTIDRYQFVRAASS